MSKMLERGPGGVPTLLGDHDLHLFNEGTHYLLYDKLGAHPARLEDGTEGTYFAVWAPEAAEVAVMGDFNGWDPSAAALAPRDSSGIWEGFVGAAAPGQLYKFRIRSRHDEAILEKADPFAGATEEPPRTASRIWAPQYDWGDTEWMVSRQARNRLDRPMSIYEIHLGSWRRGPDDRFLSYRELAPLLAEYVEQTGFTHVELLPVMEHPFYGSWGYQCTSYFAPSSRFGSPEDLMYLIDVLHQRGIGVILDWVPSHFPKDEFALGRFDGSFLFEHQDPREGHHPDWDSSIFNLGRNEVRCFLISSALFWLDRYHADGLRVDAVASMLYRDYSRREGEWIPNRYGGRENLETVEFLRILNEQVDKRFPAVQMIAEESTAWPGVTRPSPEGGLGFGLKWDLGWMHDTLRYMAREPVHRRDHHDEVGFRMLYAFTEQFVLPLSHDEVVHGKGSLLGKMPGDKWQRFANLRALFGYMYAQPGKNLVFMGGEFGQEREWNHDRALDWQLLEQAQHAGLQRWVSDLNRMSRECPALHELDGDPGGFAWLVVGDRAGETFAFLRRSRAGDEIVVIANFSLQPRPQYRVGVPHEGRWHELLNSDSELYGGSGVGNLGSIVSQPVGSHGQPHSLVLSVPPLGVLFLARPDA